MVSHSANSGLLPRELGGGLGQMGVGLFYSLSAFLLGYLYFNRDASRAELRRYGVSRVARVLPLYYVALGIGVALFLLTGRPVYEITSLNDIVWNAVLVQGTGVLWSIPVELQYYVVFAVIWWLHARRGIKLWWLLGAAFVVQLAVVALLQILAQNQVAGGLGTHNLGYWAHMFLCGLAFSQGAYKPQTRRAKVIQIVLLSLLVLVALPGIRRSLGLPTLPNYMDPLTVGVPLLIFYLALRDAAPLQFLRSRVMRWLGGVSFGVYLIHVPVISVVKGAGIHHLAPGAGFIAVMGLSMLLAWSARHLIELPAQSYLKRRCGRPVAKETAV
ncbi:acyltransferase [Rhodobacteraceae bacterium NNCM2]|nr:acyltransferase [Coraliihabitans acroporae]